MMLPHNRARLQLAKRAATPALVKLTYPTVVSKTLPLPDKSLLPKVQHVVIEMTVLCRTKKKKNSVLHFYVSTTPEAF